MPENSINSKNNYEIIKTDYCWRSNMLTENGYSALLITLSGFNFTN